MQQLDRLSTSKWRTTCPEFVLSEAKDKRFLIIFSLLSSNNFHRKSQRLTSVSPCHLSLFSFSSNQNEKKIYSSPTSSQCSIWKHRREIDWWARMFIFYLQFNDEWFRRTRKKSDWRRDAMHPARNIFLIRNGCLIDLNFSSRKQKERKKERRVA